MEGTTVNKGTTRDPLQTIWTAAGVACLPLGLLGVMNIGEFSNRRAATDRSKEKLVQVAKYLNADRCFQIPNNQGFKKGQLIPNPVETSCYVAIDPNFVASSPDETPPALEFAFVLKDENGSIRVADVFSPTQVYNQLSVLRTTSTEEPDILDLL